MSTAIRLISRCPDTRQLTRVCQFLAVHQALQQSIIDAKGALATSPFTAPLASIARIIQITIDNLVFSVNGLVPACAWEFQAAQASLEKTLDQVVQTYQLSQTKKK